MTDPLAPEAAAEATPETARTAAQTVRMRRAPYDPVLSRLARLALPFYRRFPYDGPVPITRLDPRGAAIPTSGVFYSRIPKAANSTISRILADQSGYSRRFVTSKNPKDRFLRPSHLNRAEVAALEKDWFKFTFVRNPFTRTLSAYLDKIAGRKPQSEPFYDWFRPATPREQTFTDFCDFLAAGGLWGDMHWAPQAGILLLPQEVFDFIGRFERLEDDLSEMVRRGFGPEAKLDMRQSGPTTGASSKREAHFTETARATIAALYAEDFRRFGYDPSDWR